MTYRQIGDYQLIQELGRGSMGETFCGCPAQVSQDPSSSETRSRLSMKSAFSLVFKPGTAFGIAETGFGRGPGSFALNVALV